MTPDLRQKLAAMVYLALKKPKRYRLKTDVMNMDIRKVGKIFIQLFLLSVVLISCSFHENKKDLPDGVVLDGSTLDFAGITKAVFKPRCYSCHSGSNQNGGLSLESYDQVKAKSEKIKLRAVTQRSMPPNSRLGNNNAATLGQWIDAGEPN